MQGGRLLLAVLAIGVPAVRSAEVWDAYIDLVLNNTDAVAAGGDGNGCLDSTEFDRLVMILDLYDAFTDRGTTASAEFASAACTSSCQVVGEVCRQDLVDYVVAKADSQQPGDEELGREIIEALSGIPDLDKVVSSLEVSESVKQAEAIVVLEFTLAQAPDDFFPGQKKAMKGAALDELDPCITPGASYPCTRSMIVEEDSVLTILEGSSVMTVKAFYPTEAAADAAITNFGANVGTAAQAEAMFANAGVTVSVTAAPVVAKEKPVASGDLEQQTVMIFFVIVVVLVVVSCCIGSQASKSRRRKLGAPKGGCCSCCTAYALKGWAFNNLLAIIFLLVTSFIMFSSMNETRDALSCIIDHILSLQDATSPDARAAVESLEDTLTIIEQMRPHVDLLPIAVVVPACLAAVSMLLSAGCASRTSGSMCCAKLFMLLSQIILILCIVFYAVMTALGPVVKQPFAKEMLQTITGLCETTQPVLAQTFQDATTALARVDQSTVDAADFAELVQKVADTEEPLEIFQGLCDCVTTLFDEFVNLFAPGACSVLSSIFALYVSFTSCCSAQCCCKPKVSGKTTGTAKISQNV